MGTCTGGTLRGTLTQTQLQHLGLKPGEVPRLLAQLMFSSPSILSFTGSSGREFQAATALDKAIVA